MPRYIIIEGGIGSGKTTLLDKVHTAHPEIPIIYEYIESPAGKHALSMFFNGSLDVIGFQYYIASYWFNNLFYCYKYNTVFIERGPLAALAFVTEKDFGSKQGYMSFVNFLIRICEIAGLKGIERRMIHYHAEAQDLFNLIGNNDSNCLVFISATKQELYYGVCIRNRPEERTKYDMDFLEENANKLWNIYLYPPNEIKHLIKN